MRGRVTAGGATPRRASGVRGAALRGQNGSAFNVLDAFRTDVDGRYEGRGATRATTELMAKLEGYPYDSGGDDSRSSMR